MEKKVVVVCIIVGGLGLLSTALGFAAQTNRIKRSQVKLDVENDLCYYPGSPATTLGFLAALSLLVALLIISIASGCYCCCRSYFRPSDPRCECSLALVCFILSWILFVPAFLLLLVAASLNSQRTMTRSAYVDCYSSIKLGSYAGDASLLSFISVTLGIIYYLSFTSSVKSGINAPLPSNGIAMGHPQVPPTTQQPAFVHEDTYMRRQFT